MCGVQRGADARAAGGRALRGRRRAGVPGLALRGAARLAAAAAADHQGRPPRRRRAHH